MKDLSPELKALFASTPKVSQKEREQIRAQTEKLDQDPENHAEYLKSKFVNDVLLAMEENKITKSELARRMGKSRQYLNKVLNEDDGANFTIQSMSTIAYHVGLKFGITNEYLDKTEETSNSLKIETRHIIPSKIEAWEASGGKVVPFHKYKNQMQNQLPNGDDPLLHSA
jgi:transcriptional regulator with XRE-family HTH domain